MQKTQRVRVVLAIVATLPAIGMGVFVLTMPWHPVAPFDILGVLWLMTNIPQLISVALLAGFSALAIYAWLQVLRGYA